MSRSLQVLPGRFAICRFPPDEPLPAWVFHESAKMWSITRTPEELSVVCEEEGLPPSVTPAPLRWRALQVEGPIPFEELGVIGNIAAPLAAAEVPVFVISTYDTDLVLVPAEKLAPAIDAWKQAGIDVRPFER